MTETEREAKKAVLREILKSAMPATRHVHRRRHSVDNLKLVDDADIVHGALKAVISLITPWEGTGISPAGTPDCLDMVARNEFINLLEIISDRLGAALDNEDDRHA